MAHTDSFYHGDSACGPFFEGWYFKHRHGEKVFALIPGMSINKHNRKTAFVQVISNDHSTFITYPFREFSVDMQSQTIRVGKNIFSKQGIILDIDTPRFTAKGALLYSGIRELKTNVYAPSIMGPFSYLPFMECYHGILSLNHQVNGTLQWNGEEVVFTGDSGYIEKDWGKSFPKNWVWVQCNHFYNHPGASAMLSIAHIPFLGTHFQGILFVLDLGGNLDKQYKLATYYGAKCTRLKACNGQIQIRVKQGDLLLDITVKNYNGHELKAPMLGNMERIIKETPACDCHLRLSQNGRIIFEDNGSNAGFERVV